MPILTTHAPTTRGPRGRGAVLAAALVLGLVAAPAAIAARGGGQQDTTNATFVFGDAETDAIRSDGGGSYDAQLASWGVDLETGKRRGVVFDFSDVLDEVDGARPPSGEITDVLFQPQTRNVLYAEFNAAGGRWVLSGFDLSVTPVDLDGDGVADGLDIEDDGTGTYYLGRFVSNGLRSAPHEEYVGTYRMPWTATVRLK